ncbi:MAG: phosphoribosylglycinamide formyltransferase [Bacteroidota bacterium]
MKNIAIFASGEGTNTQNIIDYFKSPTGGIKVALVVSNNPGANVLNRAKEAGIPTIVIERNTFYNSDQLIEQLRSAHIDLIVLAGFLWKIPENLIKNFPDKIINIHPALLPKYGGKGMYGINVHKAVVDAKEKESGISIHFVNENYDEGQLIEQHICSIEPSDTPETVAYKIHQLENEFFPKAIFDLLMNGSSMY